MSEDDRKRWDRRYAEAGPAPGGQPGPPAAFAAVEHLFPRAGQAFDVACGRGRGAVWLAARGMQVWGVDVSPVAVDLARDLAARCGLTGHCRFDVADLDAGLPAGPSVDVLLCYKFRDRRLDRAMVERVRPGGLLAVAACSEVGAAPGPFRARPGELREAFASLDVLAAAEGNGLAWLVARRPPLA